MDRTNGIITVENENGVGVPVTVNGSTQFFFRTPANAVAEWSARWAVFLPVPVPLATVSSAFAADSTGGGFGISVPNGNNPVTVTLSNTSGSASLAYQVDMTNGVITVTPQDLTSTNGFNNVASSLVINAPVKVFGIPQSNGTLTAYVLVYFTGIPTVQ